MKTFTIEIPFSPLPKASIRLNTRGGRYNPSARQMHKTREYVLKQLEGVELPLMRGPVLVIAHFRLPLPVLNYKKKAENYIHHPHAKRPDGDNLEKFMNDALNKVIWEDDAQICFLLRTKTYATTREGSTKLFVRALDPGRFDYNQILCDIREHLTAEAA